MFNWFKKKDRNRERLSAFKTTRREDTGIDVGDVLLAGTVSYMLGNSEPAKADNLPIIPPVEPSYSPPTYESPSYGSESSYSGGYSSSGDSGFSSGGFDSGGSSFD